MTEVKILGTAPAVPMDVTVSMTLRDYFAAQAMSGVAISFFSKDDFWTQAQRAYLMADEMMKARGEKSG